jgi:3-phosphoshikimate 1-carboxyvinyltransferase
VTGLLFALPLLHHDTKIKLTNKVESIDYINITIDVLKKFGIVINKISDNEYCIAGNQTYNATIDEITVEADYSQAAFFLVANYFGANFTLTNLNSNSLQGDRQIIDIINNSANKSIEVDMANIPDLLPILVVFCCFLPGKSRLYNAGRARLKESDRIAAICTELTKLGGVFATTETEITITGIEHFVGCEVEVHNDHRIAMALAVASLKTVGQIVINGAECVQKSFPNF